MNFAKIEVYRKVESKVKRFPGSFKIFFVEKARAIVAELGQQVPGFQIEDGCHWMNEMAAIPNIFNRVHRFHHQKTSMFDAAQMYSFLLFLAWRRLLKDALRVRQQEQ